MDHIADGVWLTGELLNPDECACLLASSQEAGYREARMKSDGRHNRESFLCRADVAAKLSGRLNSEMAKLGWVAFCAPELSATLRCYHYRPGDRVEPHYDATEQVNDGSWSALTLVVYLNDGFGGGATGFPELGVKVTAAPGCGVLFKQSLLHEGQPVTAGNKYIAITYAATSDSDSGTRRAT
jgi:predicted 2-oxoglutarate/Fe(II)-dependent dioxygenase YbiX